MAGVTSGHAAVDGMGFIQAADDDFSREARAGFPDWSGPLLPAPVFALIASDNDSMVCGSHRFVLIRGDGRHIVKVAALRDEARLTPADHRTAMLFAQGQTSSHIAAPLGLSNATMHNQIAAAAYGKLGVHTKVELFRALARDS